MMTINSDNKDINNKISSEESAAISTEYLSNITEDKISVASNMQLVWWRYKKMSLL